jgi:hypothetical protein
MYNKHSRHDDSCTAVFTSIKLPWSLHETIAVGPCTQPPLIKGIGHQNEPSDIFLQASFSQPFAGSIIIILDHLVLMSKSPIVAVQGMSQPLLLHVPKTGYVLGVPLPHLLLQYSFPSLQFPEPYSLTPNAPTSPRPCFWENGQAATR